MSRLLSILFLLLALVLLGHFVVSESLERGWIKARKRSQRSARPPAQRPGDPRKIRPCTLRGPGGRRVDLPAEDGPRIVNVWLQGCADCMPRFRAAAEHDSRDWPEPPINVAYGRADPAWADDYGVGTNLVFDPGGNLINPLGIRTFTTLVIDAEGYVRWTGYADAEGFFEDLTRAFEEAATPRQSEGAKTEGAKTEGAKTEGAKTEGAKSEGAKKASAKTGAKAPRRAPPFHEVVRRDPRVAGGVALLVLSALLFGFGGSGPAATRAWRRELVARGARCAHCSGRFDDPEEVLRCEGSCKTPYHEVCSFKAEVCLKPECTRFQRGLG